MEPPLDKAKTEYCAEYSHAGAAWALNIFAENEEDASKKIESIKSSLVLLGELDSTVPANASLSSV